MVFTVLVAADLFGAKLNYELDFVQTPSMGELRQRIDAIFGAEAGLRRPAGAPPDPFQAHRMQTFDDNVELWVDLVSMGQLQDYSQVYVFQRETPWHKEVQSKIPPPAKPPAHGLMPPVPVPVPVPVTVPASSPHMSRVATELSPGRLSMGQYRLAHAGVPVVIHRSPSPVRAVMPVPAPVYPAPAVQYHHVSVPPPVKTSLETTHADKVRSVYDDLDPRRSGAVTADDWQQAFSRLRIEIEGREKDLHSKADGNKDNVVSFSEFEKFCELYPTVLDSLFYRNRDFWLDRRQRDGIDAAAKRLDQLKEREVEARGTANEASRASETQEGKVRTQKEEVDRSQQKEKEAQSSLDVAAEDTARCRKAVSDRAADVAEAREQDRKIAALQNEASQQVQQKQQQRKLQEEETQRALQRLEDIKQLLQDQEREVERSRNSEADLANQLAQAETRSSQIQTELDKQSGETRRSAEFLAGAEKDLAAAQEREREAGVVQLQARDETARCMVKRDAEERELSACRDREAGRRRQEEEASRQVESQSKVLQGLEQENTEHNQKRMKTEEEERELLLSEVRIRAQRDNLEAEELALRDHHRQFHTTTGRAEQPPPRASPSRAAYVAAPPVMLPPAHLGALPPGGAIVDGRIVSHGLAPAPLLPPPPPVGSVVRAGSPVRVQVSPTRVRHSWT